MLLSNDWLASRSFSFSRFKRAISSGLMPVRKWNQRTKTEASVRASREPAAMAICRFVTRHLRSLARAWGTKMTVWCD